MNFFHGPSDVQPGSHAAAHHMHVGEAGLGQDAGGLGRTAVGAADQRYGSLQVGLQFVEALRHERFDRAHVLWTPDRSHDRMRFVALICGAAEIVRYDESLTPHALDPTNLRQLIGLRWRPSLAGGGGQTLLGDGLRAAYKYTVGLIIGLLLVLARNAWCPRHR